MIARALFAATTLFAIIMTAASANSAKALLKNAEGADVGSVELTQVDDGVLLRRP
jgi:Cu-Zn family superoxide dismutase